VDLSEYDEQKRKLERGFPGWHIWFVPRAEP
jgi:hypothetical protein